MTDFTKIVAGSDRPRGGGGQLGNAKAVRCCWWQHRGGKRGGITAVAAAQTTNNQPKAATATAVETAIMKAMTMTMESKTMAETGRCLRRCRSLVDCCLCPRHCCCHQCLQRHCGRTMSASIALWMCCPPPPPPPQPRCQHAAAAAAATALSPLPRY